MDKRPVRFFNTTGPCRPEMHYMLPPEERLVGSQLHRYIRDQLYWVLHAPRQTGKTTFLQGWMREINAAAQGGDGTQAISCYVSVERCQGLGEAEKAMPDLCEAIQEYAASAGLPVPELKSDAANSMLSDILRNWSAQVAPRPLVVLFDEVDVLVGATLTSFLRQLRGGFADRKVGTFPTSIALVGMRDLKDYITAAKDGVAPNPGSPFNIKEDSATLSNFQKDDIARLFAQRTKENGQQITQDALDYAYEQSKGQPWIVNSLFKRATMRILDEDSTETVTVEHIQSARKQMIEARETHLDALAYRLEDPKIRKVMETLITGEPDPFMAESEAFRLCLDLGLVAMEKKTGGFQGSPAVANPIYREVIARQMTFGTQMAISEPEWQWQKPDGSLDMDALLREFQNFWQTNSEAWETRLDYPEAFPHLLLMAFLQRITNGLGRIEREYAAGRGRMDLAVEYNGSWDIIEVKLIRQGRTFETVQAEGKKQILRYRDNFAPTPGARARRSSDNGPADCYLVIFDRRPDKPAWKDRLKWIRDGEITVVGG
jgi:hypothetical protein